MGVYLSMGNGVCTGSTAVNNVVFAGFSVQVQCASTTHTEGVSPAGTIAALALDYHRYQLYGSLDLCAAPPARQRFTGSALKIGMALEAPVKDVVLRVFGGNMNSNFSIYFN
jgi:hypothetical protein